MTFVNEWPAQAYTINPGSEESRVISVKGRERWALDALIRAGSKGCTPIDHPGPRWAAYAFRLRKHGLCIETMHESHAGPFPGHHARYVLRSTVTLGGGTVA